MNEHPFAAIRAVEQEAKKRLRRARRAAEQRREAARDEAEARLAEPIATVETVESETEACLAAELASFEEALDALAAEAPAHDEAVVEAMLRAVTGEEAVVRRLADAVQTDMEEGRCAS